MNKYINYILMCFIITSCSTYSNKFNCKDARGLSCMMLGDIDHKIDSGEIEEAYKDKKVCKSGKCKQESLIKLKRKSKADKYKVNDEYERDDYQNNIISF